MKDAASFQQLLLHGAWLRRFAGALVRDDDAADDVAQGTLVAAWQHPPAEDAKPRSWLARVAVNHARDRLRSESRREAREAVASFQPAGPATPEQLVGDLQIHRALAEEVSALDAPYREVVFLRYYEGMSAAQIARRLGVPAGTVRWRLKEGLDRVRRALDARHGGERGRWVAALAPMVATPVARLVTRGAGGAGAVGASGAIAKLAARSWQLQLGLGVVLAGGVAALVWSVVGRERGAERAAVSPAAGHGSVIARGGGPRSPRTPPRFASAAHSPGEASEPAAAVPLADPDSVMRELLAALEAGSYDDFLVRANDMMKAQLQKDDLDKVSAEVGPRLKNGYRAEALGAIRQEGHVVHLWKLSFADGDDALVRLALAEGRVAGFLIE